MSGQRKAGDVRGGGVLGWREGQCTEACGERTICPVREWNNH